MEVVVEARPDEGRLLLGGDLDITSIEAARRAFDVVAAAGAARVVVDLHDVAFMDSSALGMLVGWHKLLAAAGRTLALERVPQRIARMLSLTGLDRVLEVRPA